VSGGEQFVHPRAEPAEVSVVTWVGSGRVVTGGVGYLRAAVALALVRNPPEFALPERGIEVPPKQVKAMFRALDDVVEGALALFVVVGTSAWILSDFVCGRPRGEKNET
jgi:hypothetical protein